MTLLGGIVEAVGILLTMLQWLIIAAALVTWVSPDPRNPVVQFLFRSTDWILRPCRKILPPRWTGGIDFSPILAILLIVIVKQLVIGLLLGAPFRLF
ncbi:MAG: YggT family protein [Thermoanaerobaculia bacterium]